jgi:iron complex transport system substrate-binding protein
LLSTCFTFSTGCKRTAVDNSDEQASELKATPLFTIEKKQDYFILINRSVFQGSNIQEKYVLYPLGSTPPEETGVTHFITYPVSTVAINSTTHLGFLNVIGKEDAITGSTGNELYYHDSFMNQIEKGRTTSIGNANIDAEKILELEPDVLFSYAINAASFERVDDLRKLGVKVVLISEFLENDPLNKLAWLEFIALFFKQEVAAREHIQKVERKYDSLTQLAESYEQRPEVMIGLPWKGVWYASGGESYQASFIHDANATYIWQHLPGAGSVPLEMETVIEQAMYADYWINPGAVRNEKELHERDFRYKEFKSVREEQVYSNYKRSKAGGANDYWESGVARPDLILSDLIRIFHQKGDSADNLYYYYCLDE